jgi:hypothetical protein
MNRSTMYILLALFFSVFLICAGLLQLRAGMPPQKEGGPLDHMNGGLLWVASVLALMIASTRPRLDRMLLFWLVFSAGFGALAIDEVFAFHEETRFYVGDDDYIKIVAWAVAGAGVFLIYYVARPARAVISALLMAFGYTTLWLLSDLGDGDFFTIPIPLQTLFWLEEYFEILASMFYVTAFLIHYQDEFAAAAARHPRWQLQAASARSAARPPAEDLAIARAPLSH